MTINRALAARRGALLLVVLGLLAMFGLVAIALVVLANQARQSATGISLVDRAKDPPRQALDQALGQVVRGSNNPCSVMAVHSLLETMYDQMTLSATMSATPICGGQMFELSGLTVTSLTNTAYSVSNVTLTNSGVRCLGGCVLTDLGNPNYPAGSPQQSAAAGQSTFIVGVNPSNGNYQIAAFDNGATISGSDVCLINGAAFSGPGLGYSTSTMTITASNALRPGAWHAAINPAMQSFANTDYTAADYNHMALAAQEAASNGIGLNTPLPSFHRPELIQYGLSQGYALSDVMLRPAQTGGFTGSNPNFPPNGVWDGGVTTNSNGYQWDVDNDGDGIPDSVWIDLGFPVRAAADGRLYKPLFAILCVDLDGRLNANAHGCMAQTVAGNYTGSGASLSYAANSTQGFPPGGAALAGTSTVTLGRGLGYGPAEINLLPLFSGNYSTYSTWLAGSGSYYGRYGVDGQPGCVTSGTLSSPLDWNKWYNYAGNYWSNNYAFVPTSGTADAYAFGAPPDPQGFQAVGLDQAGAPVYMSSAGASTASSTGTSIVNCPYDLDLSRNAAYGLPSNSLGTGAPPDDPFGVAEFERVLRPYDRDSSLLPPRLANLFGVQGNTTLQQKLRCELTTLSWDNPSPAPAVPKTLRTGGNLTAYPQHVTDLLKAAGIPPNQWVNLVPAEILAGLKVNLNPPLGTLQFSGTTGTWALSGSQQFTQYVSPSSTQSLSISYDTDQQSLNAWGGAGPMPARQRLARYLYVLGMLLSDSAANVQVPTTELTSLPFAQQKWLRAQRIAQWAINAVCFETNDSIMVPFKYDPNFITNKKWSLQDDYIYASDSTEYSASTRSLDSSSNFGVVWGCKSPELVMTESFACHNRGVADTANDKTTKRRTVPDGQGTKTSPYSMAMVPTGGTTVKTLDQVRVPQGSLFIELYCPRSAWNQAAPLDLYSYSATSGYSLDLNRLAPPAAAGGVQYPVWRIVVGQSRLASTYQTTAGTVNDVSSRLLLNPDSAAIEPEQYHASPGPDPTPEFSLLPPALQTAATTTNVSIDRIIWLANVQASATTWLAPSGAIDSNLIYSNRSGPQAPTPWPLPGGHYLVIGPRYQTYIGNAYVHNAQKDNGFGHPMTAQSQYINLSSGTVTVAALNNNGAISSPPPSGMGATLTPYSMVVAGGVPGTNNWPVPGGTAWSTSNGIGISISEPIFSSSTYYTPQPNTRGPDDNGADNPTWYDTVTGANNSFVTSPMETAQTGAVDGLAKFRPMVSEKPTTGGTLLQTGTTLNYKTLFLQRLANPTMAYDPISNPYRTVDWLPVDLTVFNGTDINQQDGTHGWNQAALPVDPANGKVWMNTNPAGAVPNAAGTYVAPYAPFDPDDPVAANDNAQGGTTVFDPTRYVRFYTRQRGGQAVVAPGAGTPGYLNLWTQTIASSAGSYLTDPSQSLPPSTGATALASVATASGANFGYGLVNSLGYLNVAFWKAPGGSISPNSGNYAGTPVGTDNTTFPWMAWNNRPYASPWELLMVPSSAPSRLLWEYQFIPHGSTTANPYAVTTNAPTVAYNPFYGSLTPYPHLMPFFASEPSGGPAAGTPAQPQLYRLLEYVGVPSRFVQTETFINPNNATANPFIPPFNRISHYREPGKININTVYTSDVFNGWMNYFPGTTDGTLWGKFVQSRRGLNDSATDPLAMPSSPAPTRFANPFRTFAGGDFNLTPPATEIGATIFRSDPSGPANRPLFQIDGLGQLPSAATGSAQDPDRNPYFRYQALARLGNLTTTRSNVYAIWITVGYFQVTPCSVDAGHLDGYQLGPELGSDTGEIERHRAFYIYDRTIPVGFVRGQDTNVEKGLLLRRYIE